MPSASLLDLLHQEDTAELLRGHTVLRDRQVWFHRLWTLCSGSLDVLRLSAQQCLSGRSLSPRKRLPIVGPQCRFPMLLYTECKLVMTVHKASQHRQVKRHLRSHRLFIAVFAIAALHVCWCLGQVSTDQVRAVRAPATHTVLADYVWVSEGFDYTAIPVRGGVKWFLLKRRQAAT